MNVRNIFKVPIRLIRADSLEVGDIVHHEDKEYSILVVDEVIIY